MCDLNMLLCRVWTVLNALHIAGTYVQVGSKHHFRPALLAYFPHTVHTVHYDIHRSVRPYFYPVLTNHASRSANATAIRATSILVSRFILNLREVASGPFSDFDPTSDTYQDLLVSWHMVPHSSTTAAVSSFLAPLGAPLDQRPSFESDIDSDESAYKERDNDTVEASRGAVTNPAGADMQLVQTVSLPWRKTRHGDEPLYPTHDGV